MINTYEFRKELTKEKYGRQKATDNIFYHISEVLLDQEVTEEMIVKMFSDLCNGMNEMSKQLCNYSIKYGMIEARKEVIKNLQHKEDKLND